MAIVGVWWGRGPRPTRWGPGPLRSGAMTDAAAAGSELMRLRGDPAAAAGGGSRSARRRPPRSVTLDPLPWRSIQMGLGGWAVAAYADDWISPWSAGVSSTGQRRTPRRTASTDRAGRGGGGSPTVIMATWTSWGGLVAWWSWSRTS